MTALALVRIADGAILATYRNAPNPCPLPGVTPAAQVSPPYAGLVTQGVRFYPFVPFDPPAGKRAVGDPEWALVGGEVVESYAIEDVPELPPSDISDRQFAHGLWKQGIITLDEAKAFVRTGTIPAALDALIAQLPEEARDDVELRVSGAYIFNVAHPDVQAIATAFGWTEAELRAFWRFCGTL